MTGPDGTALAVLTTFAYLILNHHRQTKHRSITRRNSRENGHGQDDQRPQDHHQQRAREEDGSRP